MVFLKYALMCIKKVKLINHDCQPILMPLYIMLACLMLLAALSNAVCLYIVFFCHLYLQMLFVCMPCLGLLTHSLFISSIILHNAQCFYLLVFHNSMFTLLFFYERAMCFLEK